MDEATCRDLLRSATVAVLATSGAAGPHLVPIVFAVDGDTVVTAVDHKPKSTTSLVRLDNIARDDRVSVLAHHYEDDWDRLWWVRADGTARVIAADDADLTPLVAKYGPYRDRVPTGPVIEVTIDRWVGWSAADAGT